MNFSERFKATAFLRGFTFLKLPLIWWVRPSVIDLNGNKSVIEIPLSRRTKNHLNSMYFGALCIGGELVCAMKTVVLIRESKQNVDFVFKEFQAKFLKRPDGDVHFISHDGDKVTALIAKAIGSGEREEVRLTSYAVVPSKNPDEPVAEFELILSVKKRSKKS